MLAFSSKEWVPGQLADRMANAALVVLAVIIVLTFRDYGLGWDDYTHAEYGDLLISLYRSGFSDARALSFVNLYMYGGGFDMVAALAAKLLPLDLFDVRRLVGALVGLIGLAVTWRLGRRLGGPIAGLFALLLLATCPLYYGHMFMNAKDAPFAVAMAVALLGLVRAFQQYPKPEPISVALLGVGLGLTIGTRVIGGIAALYAIAAFVLLLVAEWRELGLAQTLRRGRQFVVAILPGLFLAYLVMGLVWPWSVLKPLNPLIAAEYFSHFFEKPWKEMFDGAALSVPEMPRTYVPTLFALQMPELLLMLGLAGTAGAVVVAFRRDLSANHRAVLLLVALAATLPIAITVTTRPAMYNGIRHFVFVIPALAALGGMAGVWLLERSQRIGRSALAAGAVVIIAGAISPVIEMVRLHPYQYTHFNRVAGGVRAADDHYMIDYWGLAFKQAALELRSKLAERSRFTSSRPWKVAVCGPNRPAAVELGSGFVTTWDSKGADFALMLGEFYCASLKAPTLVTIEREGVVYARVYDIRERTVSSVFTIPPP
ncbi:MAG TPA: glycosyltransferase family 39 protein [Xanthobacteraceae bacterium]|jgi:4-amino-4-deoxy-L-arabinose transferase-like glycosyltransferase|nr:glycosyltransferase family 39 protein [Xanthobacteraceae bacterium]